MMVRPPFLIKTSEVEQEVATLGIEMLTQRAREPAFGSPSSGDEV